MAHNLLHLPGEVLHSILIYVRPEDLAALRCCHSLDDFIRNDGLLHKEIYHRYYVSEICNILMNGNDNSWQDVPGGKNDVDWETELQKLVHFKKTMSLSNEKIQVVASRIISSLFEMIDVSRRF